MKDKPWLGIKLQHKGQVGIVVDGHITNKQLIVSLEFEAPLRQCSYPFSDALDWWHDLIGHTITYKDLTGKLRLIEIRDARGMMAKFVVKDILAKDCHRHYDPADEHFEPMEIEPNWNEKG